MRAIVMTTARVPPLNPAPSRPITATMHTTTAICLRLPARVIAYHAAAIASSSIGSGDHCAAEVDGDVRDRQDHERRDHDDRRDRSRRVDAARERSGPSRDVNLVKNADVHRWGAGGAPLGRG